MNINIVVLYLLHLNIYRVFSQNTGEGLLPKECGKPLSYNPFFGAPTTPANAYPWIAALFTEDPRSHRKYISCLGTLINSRYVLTTAACVKDPSRKLYIRLGEWDTRTEEDCTTTTYGPLCLPRPIDAGPEEIIIHPSYDTTPQYSDDIALIRLNITVDFNAINGLNPICLPPDDFIFKYAAYERRSFAAGWGAIYSKTGTDNEPRPVLRSVALPLADGKCQEIYPDHFVESKQLCVGTKGADTCYGEAGGPLILPGPSDSSYIVVGIVSFGKECEIYPSVYTSVVAYKSWILQNLKP